MEHLVETALLTHGLRSITNADLAAQWRCPAARLAWVDRGRLQIGDLSAFLPFRTRAAEVCRIDCNQLEAALTHGVSGALTASGTMAACAKLGIGLAVTCGMGGIGPLRGEALCPDLPALCQIPVALIATSPKDMLDIPATLAWLQARGVHLAGPDCTGYLFVRPSVALELPGTAVETAAQVRQLTQDGGLLLLQPIPAAQRITDRSILEAAMAAGRAAEDAGAYYHPAANGEIDRRTGGVSSQIQLVSLQENIRLAASLA